MEFSVFDISITNNQREEFNKNKEVDNISMTLENSVKGIKPIDNMQFDRLLGIPKIEGLSYQDVLLKCVGGLYASMLTSNSKTVDVNNPDNKDKYNTDTAISESGYSLDLTYFMSILGQLNEYLLNSASMRSKQFQGFDAIEFKQRLLYLVSMCDRCINRQ